MKRFLRKPEISELTLRERIGQTASPIMTKILNQKNIPEYMEKNPYGFFWVGGNAKLQFVNVAYEVDPKTVDKEFSNAFRKLMGEINAGLRIPAIPGMDAERGAKRVICNLTELTTATGLAASDDESVLFEAGATIAREVRSCGVRWIWGPVADNAPPASSVMLGRTFSTDPDVITKYAVAYTKGMQGEGVAASVKHFPGHDSLDYRDSHIAPVAILDSYDEWYERQGRIFEACAKAGAMSMMVGHTAFPALDDSTNGIVNVPATASKKIITGILREKFGYNGVLVTDAVEMGGICDYFETNLDMYAAIYEAGIDIILGAKEDNFIDIIEEAVLSGRISEETINTACQRVLDMKEKLGMFSEDALDFPSEAEAVAKTVEFSRRTANKTISWVQKKNDLVPLNSDKIKKVALVYVGYSKTASSFFDPVIEEFCARGAQSTLFTETLSPTELYKIRDEYDLALYFIHLAPHSPYGTAGFVEDQAMMFNYITKIDKDKSIAVATESPYVWHDWLPGAANFINIYGWDNEVLRALVRGIYGECEFLGKCPMPLNPLRRK
ncbi:MAG: glycoside hydrolase family 3 protein [Clostridia bacterium]|nr:glycoside hydrolase family 3 protein [Clostridia bacterium]